MAKKRGKRSSKPKRDRQTTGTTEGGTVIEHSIIPVVSAPETGAALSVTSPLSPDDKRGVASVASPLSDDRRPDANAAPLQLVSGAATASHASDTTVSPLDHILIFGHGVFQKLILLCTQLAVFCSVVHAEAAAILARPVDHWCRAPAAYANLPPETWKNASIPVEKDGSYSRCYRYEPLFLAQGAVSSNNRSTVPCDTGWEYADSTRSSIVGEWDLVCNRRWVLSLLTAFYMAGSVFAMPFAGAAADRLGRRPVLGASLAIIIVSGIMLAFSKTLVMFATLRFFISASAGSLVVISIVLLFEVIDSSRRVLYCSIAVTGGYSAAHVYGELVHGWVNDWSLSQLACMVPTGLLIGAVYFVQESPCWLLATFQIRNAADVVLSAAEMNGEDMQLVVKRLEVIMEEARKARAQALTASGEVLKEASPVELFTNRAFRKETLVVYGCWFLANSFSYRLRESPDYDVVNHALLAFSIPAVAANVFLLSTKGRRFSTAVSMVILGSMIATRAAVTYFLPSSAHIFTSTLGTVVLIAELLAAELAVISLYVITVEIYPTVLRGCGISLGFMCGRLGAIVTPLVEAIESSGVQSTLLTATSILLVAFGALAWRVLPETTKVHAVNTVHDRIGAGADKWMLNAPLTVARRHSRALLHPDRRRSSSTSLSRMSRLSRESL